MREVVGPDSFPAGTLDFPVKCATDRVAGLRIDGRAFKVPMKRIQHLNTYDAKALFIYPLPNDVRSLEPILDDTIPHLESLRIETTLMSDEEAIRRHYWIPPTYTLRGKMLPKLHTLRLRNIMFKSEASLYRKLRSLHLEFSGVKLRIHPGSLYLADFFQILRQCTKLEHLYVESYLYVRRHAQDPPLPLLRLASDVKSLTRLAIADSPANVSNILSRMVIPARVNVIATGLLQDGDDAGNAFGTMLPDNTLRGNLEILGCATQLTMHHEGDYKCLFAGSTRIGDADVGLSMELFLNNASPRNRALLATMIDASDAFRGSPVKTIRLKGDLRPVSELSWTAMLNRFPDTEALEVEVADLEPTALDSLNSLFTALAPRARPGVPARVSFPLLQRLVITAGVNDASSHLMNVLCNCFLERAKFGAPLLRELVLDLEVDRLWDADTEARYRERLASVTSGVEIMPLRIRCAAEEAQHQ